MNPIQNNANLQFSEATYIKDGVGYAIPFNMNGLFKVDINKGTCEYIHFFLDEPPALENLYTNIVEYGDKLIFIPGSAENLVIFDPKKDEYKTIRVLSDRLNGFAHYAKYAGCIEHNGKLYFPGERYSYILKLDPITGETTYINIPDDTTVWTRHGIVREGGIVKIPSAKKDKLLVFNLQTENVQIQERFSFDKLKPELTKIKEQLEKRIDSITNVKLDVVGGMDLYYESYFKSYAVKNNGRMIIREDAKKVSFNDIVEYIEWEKAR